jgi:hypothetical protein
MAAALLLAGCYAPVDPPTGDVRITVTFPEFMIWDARWEFAAGQKAFVRSADYPVPFAGINTYVSLQDGNAGNPPATSPTWWELLE